MLYDIICPLCTRRFAANDVVFRHSAAGVNSVNADVADYRGTDYYMQAFNTRTGIKQNAVRMRAVDPAYFREQDKIYSNDLLVGLHSELGYRIDERICPYCHNKLFAGAGRLPMQLMSIIGSTHAGKTTFEAAMIYQLGRDGIGCTNNTLDEFGNRDDVVEQNIRILMRGDPERRRDVAQEETIRALSWGQAAPQAPGQNNKDNWHATEQYNGPYIFSLSPGQGATAVNLAFYDLPGEHFRTQVEMIRRRAPYIATAKTCICMLDLTNLEASEYVVSTLHSSGFGEEMRANQVNMALVLYTADQLNQYIEGLTRVVSPTVVKPGAPIDLTKIEADSAQLLRFVVPRNPKLQSLYNAISEMLGDQNVRLFTAQAYDEAGNFAPRGCDIPLLWSFARQGLYPAVQ